MTTGLDIILVAIGIICGIYAGLIYLNKAISDDTDRLSSDDE